MSARWPLAAYVPWQVRYAIPRAATPLALFLVFGVLPIWGGLAGQNALIGESALGALRQAGDAQRLALAVYGQSVSLCMTLGAIVSVNGIIALDRERQYFRFLFSHPVVPWMYYLQQFVISTLLFVAAMALIPVGFGFVVTDVPILPVVQSALLYGLVFGALALLCSALMNRDGLLFIALLVLTSALQQVERQNALPTWLAGMANALPPLVTADAVRTRWLLGQSAVTGDVVLVVGYALAMLAAALFIVRRAPLAR